LAADTSPDVARLPAWRALQQVALCDQRSRGVGAAAGERRLVVRRRGLGVNGDTSTVGRRGGEASVGISLLITRLGPQSRWLNGDGRDGLQQAGPTSAQPISSSGPTESNAALP
jgi:hypothetical protein